MRKHWRKVLLNSLVVTRGQLEEDNQCIKENKDIFEKKYRKTFDFLDKEANAVSLDKDLGDPLKYVKQK